ncbi:MAG: TonB-dependent receptor [Burkholderiales bacterium]|nr:TonB-dependent receptor [Burkholderiales bacterium]
MTQGAGAQPDSRPASASNAAAGPLTGSRRGALPKPDRLLAATAALAALWLLTSPAFAQSPPAEAPKPAAPPSAPSTAQQLDKVEVRGAATAASRRRNSTASKIVIDREEISRFGDTQLGDVLRRLPGVTLGGRPGRGGDIRLRGLGGGFTQILIDGERAPAGFNVDQLPPDQVERIEILRAATAETGARAVAGTINIILREPIAKTQHELRLGLGGDHGDPQADFNWTRNLKWGGPQGDDWLGALSANGSAARRWTDIDLASRSEWMASGAQRSATRQQGGSESDNANLNTNLRLRWKLSDTQSLHFSPFAFLSRWRSRTAVSASGYSSFDATEGEADGQSAALRLNATWQWRRQPTERIELRVGSGINRSESDNLRRETRLGQLRRTQDDHTETRDDNTSLGAKWSLQTTREHQWVSGLEWERGERAQTRQTLENGQPKPGLEEFGDSLSAGTRRLAVYTQDEWSPTKQWSIYAGLRWEAIETRGDPGVGGGVALATRTRNAVASPLFHLLWKPEQWPRDQVRASLTRTWRAPGLNDLIAKPVVNASYPSGANPQSAPDRAGNPLLKAELATGLDLSWEHWLSGGGILTIGGHVRWIDGLIRNLLAQEVVPWDASPRWVSRPRNLSRARTAGLELEAKARLDELWPQAPESWENLLLRANLALFRSQVDGIPGPNNRLDQQPKGTMNLGADYLWPGGVRSGFNWSFVPGDTLQQTEILRRENNLRSVWDAYFSWSSGDPRNTVTWRLSLANLAPRETRVLSIVESDGIRSTTLDRKRSFRVWNLRAETRF